jgi:hypothetical protein
VSIQYSPSLFTLQYIPISSVYFLYLYSFLSLFFPDPEFNNYSPIYLLKKKEVKKKGDGVRCVFAPSAVVSVQFQGPPSPPPPPPPHPPPLEDQHMELLRSVLAFWPSSLLSGYNLRLGSQSYNGLLAFLTVKWLTSGLALSLTVTFCLSSLLGG